MGEWDEVTQIRRPAFAKDSERILLADGDHVRRTWLRQTLAGHYDLEEIADARTALERLAANPPRVLVVGSELADVSGSTFLAHAAKRELVTPQAGGPVTFLLGDTADDKVEVDEARVPIFYRLTTTLQPARVLDLLTQAIARMPKLAGKFQPSEADALRTRQVLEHAKRLGAQRDTKSAARTAVAAVVDLLPADRARCLYCDDETGALWSEEEDGEAKAAQASVGVAGYAVRTRSTVVLPHAAEDPGYRKAIDDPSGTGSERLAVQPVLGSDGAVHAVLIGIRTADHPPFAEEDIRRLEALAEAWAPFVQQLAEEVEADQVLQQRAEGAGEAIFRQEAILNLVRRGQRGDVVRVHPGWIRAAYWMVVLSVVGLIGFAAVAQVHQYAEGPAVVRISGRSDVTAYEGGTITRLEVGVGQTVHEGQILARLHDTEQAGRLRALEGEFERKLIAYLQSPADPAIRQALGALVSQREAALAGVESRQIRATHAGVIKEIHVRDSQRIEAGKTVMSIAQPGATEGITIVAFLPGGERPRLRPGQRLRLTLPGYRGAHVELTVQDISADVLGGSEASARYLRLGDKLPMADQVVVVEAHLADPRFEADGEHYELHDGMVGIAEVQLASRSVLETVVPGMER